MNRRLIFLLTLASALSCRAEVKLPAIFGDHMVLQQTAKVPIWGTADPGEKVTVTLGTKTAQTSADAKGQWRVAFPPSPATATPVILSVAGKNTVKFEDVLVGEVWLCSGQSNMAFAMGGSHAAREDIPLANDPQLRFFRVASANRLEPQTDLEGKWELCTPQTVGGFSAVGYYFGRELRKTFKRPVGLISSSWGGTPAQSWTSISALQKEPSLRGYVQAHAKALEGFPQRKEAYPQQLEEYKKQRAAWEAEVKPAYDAAMKDWNAAARLAQENGASPPPRPQPSRPNPGGPGDPNGGPNVPSSLFNGMIAPLIPYAIKGAIWYQGESNAPNAPEYDILFPRMISDWRERWGAGDFPFLFVQLANYKVAPNRPDTNKWARLREAQLKTLALPNTGMASAVDIGNPNDIHPKDKRDVGTRLAQAAKRIAYQQDAVPCGPLYAGMKVEGKKIRISFKSTGAGLTIGVPPWMPDGTTPAIAEELTDFMVAGADTGWHPAKARIDGQSVLVWSDEVSAPVAVRYGWSDSPVINLYNKEGLPASPFRTDKAP